MLQKLFCVPSAVRWVPSECRWEGRKQLDKRLFYLYVDFQFVLIEPFLTFIFQVIFPKQHQIKMRKETRYWPHICAGELFTIYHCNAF